MVELLARYTSRDYFDNYPHPLILAKPDMQEEFLTLFIINAAFFGFVTQQFYGYWACGFKDSLCLKLFVIIQYLINFFQGLMALHVAWYQFIILPFTPLAHRAPPGKLTWDWATFAICQLFLILQANVFLAHRIHSLTKSLFQSGLVIILSIVAFATGVVTLVAATESLFAFSTHKIITIVWHAVQAVVEGCITVFLVRALLKSRSGFRRSDSIVNILVRDAIQTGALATTWAIAGLVPAFFMPHNTVYRIFDATSGSVYTVAIFETLISRTQLRGQMLVTTSELGDAAQDELDRSSRPHRGSSHAMGVLCLVPGPDPRASISSNDSNSIEKDHSGKAAAPYEFSHIPYQAVEPTPSG